MSEFMLGEITRRPERADILLGVIFPERREEFVSPKLFPRLERQRASVIDLIPGMAGDCWIKPIIDDRL